MTHLTLRFCLLMAGKGRAAEDEYAVVNGVKLHLCRAGHGAGGMLFLHGFPEFWYAWKNQLPEFGKTHRAIARTCAATTSPRNPRRWRAMPFPSWWPISRRFWTGKPWQKGDPGGARLGRRHRLGLCRAAPGDPGAVGHHQCAAPDPLYPANAVQPGAAEGQRLYDPFPSPGAEQLLSANNYAALSGAVFGGSTKPERFTPADRKAYLDAWSQPGALTGGLNYYRAAQLGPPTPGSQAKPGLTAMQLPDVKVPTLVIWGEKDTALLIGNLDGLDKVVPHLTIKRIPNGSHWVSTRSRRRSTPQSTSF